MKIYLVIWENGQSYEDYSEAVIAAYSSNELANLAISKEEMKRDQELLNDPDNAPWYSQDYKWRIQELVLVTEIQ